MQGCFLWEFDKCGLNNASSFIPATLSDIGGGECKGDSWFVGQFFLCPCQVIDGGFVIPLDIGDASEAVEDFPALGCCGEVLFEK